MLSIKVHYSPDRLSQLRTCIACLEHTHLYERCEKVLCVDGSTNIEPPGWKIVEVSRPGLFFSRPKMWREGVEACSNDIIVYLDSDRIIPKFFFQLVRQTMLGQDVNDMFVFPLNHYYIRASCSVDIAESIRENPSEYAHLLEDDSRSLSPLCINGKNPMSGCVAFSKRCFEKSGGLDPRFEGWRMADTDYFMSCKEQGFRFLPLADCCDFHLHHAVDPDVELFYLWNGMKFLAKWKLHHPIFKQIAAKYKVGFGDVDAVREMLVQRTKYRKVKVL